ncbi:MAG: HAD family hydrolase [Propionibacteriales bacterium]|nr:HAD family hydrolase [Propionibacteriales bacterium]
MLRAILFDLDDTLLDHHSAAAAAVVDWAAELGLAGGPDHVRARWAEASDRHYRRYQARELTFVEQRRERVREFLGHNLDDAEADDQFGRYLTRYEAGWAVFPDVRPALGRVRAAGFAAAILTNGDASHQALKVRRLGLRDLPVMASSEFPAGKPDPRAFLGACARLGVAPAETLMVGDSLDNDVRGAEGADLQAVLLDRHDQHPSYEGPRITTLHDLPLPI